MLIPRCNSVHTFWMKYPIAVLFLDKNGHVLKKCASLPPRRLAGCSKAKFALEVAAGTEWVASVGVGSMLRWESSAF